jgi:HlyD family secretion protein
VSTVLAPEARDFAPDLLTLQESPPSALPRLAVLLVVVLLGLLGAWSVWARLDIVATAQGRLVPATYTKLVQPAEAGVVSEILVRDGDAVRAGQVLLRLDASLAQTDVASLEQEAMHRRLTLHRIEAELADRPFLAPVGSTPHLASQVAAQYLARRQSFQDATAQEQASLLRAQAELASADQHLIKLREVLPIVRAAADKHQQLEQSGFVSALVAADRRRDLVEKTQELQAQLSTVDGLRAAIAQGQRKLDAVRSSYRTQLENERVETLGQLRRLAQDLDKTAIRKGQMDIRAPADGIVKDLAVTSVGAVVQAGALLMNIVPRDEPLLAEVMLGNEDAGFVAVGQKVQLKIAAYPFQKYGLLEGTVTHIGADASDSRQGQAGQPPSYRALVKLARQRFDSARDEALALAPGMLLVAEIHQGDRTVMEYLLSPVQKVAAEAARER